MDSTPVREAGRCTHPLPKKIDPFQMRPKIRAMLLTKRIGWLAIYSLFLLAGTIGCTHLPGPPHPSEVDALRAALSSLSPGVRAEEAREVSECAYHYPVLLAERYRVVRPALLHNFLVNSGYKNRGLCYEWAEDLLEQLKAFELETLELHWGIARANTAREHNSIVVTARGHPFGDGIVLDPWRRSGRLVWAPVATDKYPWIEGDLEATPPALMP